MFSDMALLTKLGQEKIAEKFIQQRADIIEKDADACWNGTKLNLKLRPSLRYAACPRNPGSRQALIQSASSAQCIRLSNSTTKSITFISESGRVRQCTKNNEAF